MGLGQYDSLGEYCGPRTASTVFLILVIIFYYGDHVSKRHINVSIGIQGVSWDMALTRI